MKGEARGRMREWRDKIVAAARTNLIDGESLQLLQDYLGVASRSWSIWRKKSTNIFSQM
jgi:hypothetical protein